MAWVIAAILIFMVISFVFVLLYKSISSTALSSHDHEDPKIPKSRTSIDLSVFDQICKNEGKDGKVDFNPLSEEDNTMIKDLLSQQKPLPPDLLKRTSPIKIVYSAQGGEKTIREIIPHRVIGSVDVDEDGTKEYDFYIEAYCLLRNNERSFHTNGISAAWFQGRENNLGNYLATLYRQCRKN
jgi:hypothetical protein